MQHGTDYNGNYYVPTSTELKRASKVAYCGWYQSRGTYGSDGVLATDALKQYAFTQQLIWETLNQSTAHFVDSSIQSQYEAFKIETNNKIDKMNQRASFNGSTITLKIGETTTVTDTNDVLKDYNSIDRTENNIRITHNKGENTMSFTANENCNIESYVISDNKFQEWGLIKEGTEDNQTTVYIEFQSSEVQDQLYSLGYNDPVTLRVNLAIEAKGRLEITKLDSEGTLVDGAVFTLSNDSGFSRDITVSGGKIMVEDLKPGIFLLREKTAPYGYLLDTKDYQVEVRSGETVNKTIPNDEPARNIKTNKN